MGDDRLLSHDETLELIERSHSGDGMATDTLVRRNTALVKSIVRRFLHRGVEYDDLYQIGCVGLVKAINNYDTAFKVRFSTYAVPMIMGEIKRFLRDDGMIKVSRSLKELAARVAAMQEKLCSQLGREVGISEIAQALGEDVCDVVMALESACSYTSIYEPAFGDDSDACIADQLSDGDEQEKHVVDSLLLKQLLSTLEPRERQLILLRFFQDKTQNETAKALGVSQVQISRLENKILKKLRDAAG